MGSLRDELLKARLITSKQANKAARESQVDRKKLGNEGMEKIQEQKQLEYTLNEEQKAEKDREISRKHEQELVEAKRIFRLKDIVLNSEIQSGTTGPYRFHFVTRDNKIPYLEISPQMARDLQNGKAAIVETPGEEREIFRIITREGAMKLGQEGSQYIRFFIRTTSR